MGYKIISATLLLFVFSCSSPKSDPLAQKQNLTGYWEIKAVEMPNGTTRNFDLNTTVDYIELNGDSGKRTKVSPKLDGTFITNGLSEDFTLRIEDDSLRMYYKTPFDEWKETVIEAKDTTLTVINRDNKIYSYGKFKKFHFKE